MGFEDALRRHQTMVFGLAYHTLRNAALAEEVAQEVFLQLHRSLAGLESDAHVLLWLRRVTSHRCLDVMRSPSFRRQVSLESIPEPAHPESQADPLAARRLRALVAALPPTARLVVTLRYQEDLEPREIAEVLQLPLNTVKSRLQRALALMRSRFAAPEEVRHAAPRG
jgi:RNA polymerase sigma-70 factor (ECF subfamily)